MSNREITYTFDARSTKPSNQQPPFGEAIPRIARLMALAIRFKGLIRDGKFRDYAELARLGHVTRGRMTQIMQLLHLAPDIQEQIMFLPPIKNLNERNLRFIVARIDWAEQRSMFERFINRAGDSR